MSGTVIIELCLAQKESIRKTVAVMTVEEALHMLRSAYAVKQGAIYEFRHEA